MLVAVDWVPVEVESTYWALPLDLLLTCPPGILEDVLMLGYSIKVKRRGKETKKLFNADQIQNIHMNNAPRGGKEKKLIL